MRTPIAVARDRFLAARVARLATVSESGAPHLVPVTFAVIPATLSGIVEPTAAESTELIVFAIDHKPKSTTALRRLDNIAANPRVAFLVDVYDDNWDRLWWVRADASAGVIDREQQGRRGCRAPGEVPAVRRPSTGRGRRGRGGARLVGMAGRAVESGRSDRFGYSGCAPRR